MRLLLAALAVLLTIAVYEALRALLVRWIRQRLKDSAKAYVRRHEVRLDRFKLTRRAFLKTELLADPVITEAMARRAQERDVPVTWVYTEVEEYLDEIIPAFSLLSYFKVGLLLTRLVVNAVYDVIFHKVRIQQVNARVPEGAVVLYLMNHRSNFDYLVVSLMLSRTIALSYAVGEWARVWPLDRLFRSFGSYFVRRGEKDPLYHLVLKRYVQRVGRYGITQGIFPEGGLTRDGFFREPKLGLLTYLTELLLDPSFEKDILVVPVAINYDRVLEDRVLVREALRGARPPTLGQKLKSGLVTLVRAPGMLLTNGVRVLIGRAKRHGYATASFGEPLSVRAYLDREGAPFATLDEGARRERVRGLAREVMARIGGIMPVTPVPLTCLAVLRLCPVGSPLEVDTRRLEAEVRQLHDGLRRQGAWLVGGAELASSREARDHLEAEREERRAELVDIEDAFVQAEESRETLDLALRHLRRRGITRRRGETIVFKEADRPLLRYYAASLLGLVPEAEGPLRAGTHPASTVEG